MWNKLGFKKGDKIWFHQVGSERKPAVFIKYAENGTVIIKEVGKLNSQGYSMTRPFGINVTLIQPRKERITKYKTQKARQSPIGGTEAMMMRTG